MAEITRLSGYNDWLELDFVAREQTPSKLMKLGIRLHLAGLLLSNTISELENFGVQRSRKAVHDWVQKADLQPASDASPDHVALDETVIRINGQQYWLYATVDPETNRLHHIRLFTITTTALTQKLCAKHNVSEAVFLVYYAHHHRDRNAVERVFREIKRWALSFRNSFSHVQPTTAETWLQAFAVWWKSLN